ncbi:MAG: putative glycoside hydrolase [Bacillota bacterium]
MRFRLAAASLIIFLLPLAVLAEPAYPRLANYFLKWEISSAEAEQLAKWDLLILDMEIQENNPDLIRHIRRLNPEIKILAYITSQEIYNDAGSFNNAPLRGRLYQSLDDDWFLRSSSGSKVVNWPSTSMLNLSEEVTRNKEGYRYNEFLPRFIHEEIQATGLWDGVFYDNIWGDIAWVNGGDLDFDNDGRTESALVANSLWAEGVTKLLRLTRELCGPSFLIMGNGRVYWPYQPLLNGMMLEGFPSSWENGGTWKGSMSTYLKLPSANSQPNTPVINLYNKKTEDYQKLRYGLTSTLLGDGYFSRDYDVTDHGQTWWYDEYDVNLGTPKSQAYNILRSGSNVLEPGLWRRDFTNGIALLNSTDKLQSFVFSKEEFEKIKGDQAPLINDGKRINSIKLAPNDGIILFKKLTAWQGSGFVNGSFLRVFSPDGTQARNGFFSYVSSLPAGSETLIDRFNGDSEEDYLYYSEGSVIRQKKGKTILNIKPFSAGYRGTANLAAGDINGDGKPEFVVGAGQGGGPQVRVFTFDGRPLLNFFAYDKNFRGGVNVAVGDIDGDGVAEIITGAGKGGGPHIRYFDGKGQVVGSFFAYDKNFRGGVNVAVGDIDGDGVAEIITGPGAGGGPQVRIFDGSGLPVSSFFAFEKDFRDGIRVGFSMASGLPEIAAGIIGF